MKPRDCDRKANKKQAERSPISMSRLSAADVIKIASPRFTHEYPGGQE